MPCFDTAMAEADWIQAQKDEAVAIERAAAEAQQRAQEAEEAAAAKAEQEAAAAAEEQRQKDLQRVCHHCSSLYVVFRSGPHVALLFQHIAATCHP